MQQNINSLNASANAICLQDGQNESNKVNFDYSMFTKEGFELDNELLEKFQTIIEKLNLSPESLKMLLEIALEMSLKQKSIYEKDEETRCKENIAKYDKMFKIDNELPNLSSSEIKSYMKTANSAYSSFATPKLKETLEKTGLNFHPELIKMFYKIGSLIEEDSLNHTGAPVTKELTPAQILYGPRE